MNGPVDVAGNRITGVLDEARLFPGHASALSATGGTGYANPVIVTLGFDALSYSSSTQFGVYEIQIFRFQPKPTG